MQVHSITKQLEYKGKMVDLTETISHLPAGSQVLLSSASFEKLFGRLHELRLTAASGLSQGSPQPKRLSKEYTQALFVSSNRMHKNVAAALWQAFLLSACCRGHVSPTGRASMKLCSIVDFVFL